MVNVSSANPKSNGGLIHLFQDSNNYQDFFINFSGDQLFLKEVIGGVKTKYLESGVRTITKNNFINVSFTYDYNKIKIYVNGILLKEFQEQLSNQLFFSNVWLGVTTGGYYIKSLMQDVRIYDHCLSDKEIYELAKAKVLHYTFDDVEEPTVNEFFHSTDLNNLLIGQTLVKQHLDITRLSKTHFKAQFNQDISTTGSTITQVSIGSAVNRNMGYTISAKIIDQFLKGDSSLFGIGRNNAGGADLYKGKESHTYPDAITVAITIRSGANATVRKDSYIIWDEMQLEYKDHATPFVNGTRDNIIVRDKSDYGNHCVTDLATTPAFVDDCKLGEQGVRFSSDKLRYLKTTKPWTNGIKNISFSFYFKFFEAQFNLYPRLLDSTIAPDTFKDGFGIYLENKNQLVFATRNVGNTADVYFRSLNNLVSNKFYHCSLTFENDNASMYIDGIKVATRSSSDFNPSKLIASDLFVGQGESDNYNGKLNGIVDDLRIYATALTAEDVKDLYEVRASLDDKGNLFVGSLTSVPNKKRIVDYSWWNYTGQATAPVNGSFKGIAADSNFKYDYDPFGKKIIVWECKPDASNTANGGWNNYGKNEVDITKKYRLSVWVKRSVLGNSGIFFFGPSLGEVLDASNQEVISNPYFANVNILNPIWSSNSNEWILAVGYVYPYGFSGAQDETAGFYKVKNGKTKVAALTYNTRFTHKSDATGISQRAYLFYANTDLTVRQEFCYPRIDMCDGTEPSIDDLLNGYDSRNYDLYMQKGNVSNVFDLNEKGILTVNNISEIGVTEGLVAWYPLNGDAKDYSGNGNDGVVVGATVAAGLVQKCYQFDGVDDYIPTNFKQNVLIGDFTVSLWCKLIAPVDGSSDGIYGGHDFSASYKGFGLQWYQNSLHPFYGDGTSWKGWQQFTSNDTIYTSWFKIDIIYKPNSSISKYINGILIEQKSCSGLFSPDVAFDIGTANRYADRYTNGKIQDVRIYNRALTPEEVLINYNLTKADKTAMIQAENGTTYINKIKEV